jgi:orotate phosphoribosyltransferase
MSSDDGLDRQIAEGLSKTDAITPKNFVVLHSSGQGTGFVDIDSIITDKEYGEILVQNIIDEIKSMSCEFDKVAFLDKDYGPTGLISGASEISRELDKDFVVVKLWDTLRFNELKIKGGPIQNGESILILDDVITSGETQKRAQNIIRKAGGNVAGVYAVLARDMQAYSELKKEEDSVQYECMTTLSELQGAGLAHSESAEDILESDVVKEYIDALDGGEKILDEEKIRQDLNEDVDAMLDDLDIDADPEDKKDLADLYFRTITYFNDSYA